MSRKRASQTKTPRPRRRATSRAREQAEPDAVRQAVLALDGLKPKSRKAKNAIALFKSWLRDESGYDEDAWPELKQALDERRARVGARSLFDA